MKVNKSNIKKFFQSIFKVFFYSIFKLKHGKIIFDEKIQSKLCKEEYSLKKNQFYPEQPSPNLFCNRLELRMKAYYETLKRDFKL